MNNQTNIEALQMQNENNYEGSMFEAPPTKKEKEDSRAAFVSALKDAVKQGGEVIVNENGSIGFTFKVTGKNIRYSISKADAIEFCGYAE